MGKAGPDWDEHDSVVWECDLQLSHKVLGIGLCPSGGLAAKQGSGVVPPSERLVLSGENAGYLRLRLGVLP